MGAIASYKAQTLPIECVSDSKTGPAAYGVIGLVMAYIIVLALAIVANLSVEEFEAIVNVAAIAGFAIFWAAFWNFNRTANDHPRHDSHRALSADLRKTASKAGSPSMSHWGPPPTIGSISE
jgi:hypothetical protein